MARQLEDEGAHMLAIKDMAGLLKPAAAEVLIREMKKAVSLPIHLHTHDTATIQAATYLKAVEADADVIDLALGGLSGLTSQPNFNSVVAMLQGHPRELKLDLPSLNAYSNYWEDTREWYYPFESGLKTGTAEVYEHEIPGGQYSNLKPQAASLGLEARFEEMKKNYVLVNKLFGDIVKVTPSSKVVGDMALFMTSNNLTPEDLFEKGKSLSFPESVKSFFRGELGQPYGGFPAELQKIILKGEKPITGRPNEHLEPVDFDKEFNDFKGRFGDRVSFLDYLSCKMYPKVFEEFQAHRQQFSDVSVIQTCPFFYGLKPGEETTVNLVDGKMLIIKLLFVAEPDEEGNREASFELNGTTRTVEVRDKSVKVTKVAHRKAKGTSDIGAPLQGKLSKIMIKAGDEFKEDQPLFVIEAMKMETIVSAPKAGKAKAIVLPEGEIEEQDDAVIEVEEK